MILCVGGVWLDGVLASWLRGQRIRKMDVHFRGISRFDPFFIFSHTVETKKKRAAIFAAEGCFEMRLECFFVVKTI